MIVNPYINRYYIEYYLNQKLKLLLKVTRLANFQMEFYTANQQRFFLGLIMDVEN
jgi:hypothetical protein